MNQNNEKKTSKNEKSQKVKVKVMTLVLHVIYVNKGNLGKLEENCPPKIQNCPLKNRKKNNCPPNFEIVRQKIVRV